MNYPIPFLLGLYTDHQLGCGDKKEKQEQEYMRKEAKMEMLCHVKRQEVEYGLTKHGKYRHILELQ